MSRAIASLSPGFARSRQLSPSDARTAASGDRLALGALEAALAAARHAGEDRPALEVVASSLADIGVRSTTRTRSLLTRDRDAWLLRLRGAARSPSSLTAYRNAIDDLIDWAHRHKGTTEVLEEHTIIDYLADYRARRSLAPATYHRHFLLLRRFVRWVSQRNGLPDPFLELEAPAKPRHEADSLTREEFACLLGAAAQPARRRAGMAERDQLVLLALVMTGLRRSELIALDWRDGASTAPDRRY